MKAKRILSLLLTVAMVATIISAFGMTAFAAPEGYVQTFGAINVNETTLAQQINPRAVRPNPDELAIEFTITKATDAEIKSQVGIRTIPAGFEGKGYIVDAKFVNCGTLLKTYDTDYSEYSGGFAITTALVDLVPVNLEAGTYKTATGNKSNWAMSAAILADGHIALTSTGLGYGPAFPASTTTTGELFVEDAVIEYIFAIFAEEGATFKLDNAAVTYSNYKYNDNYEVWNLTEDGQPYTQLGYGPWHPATITLGTATEPDPEPDPEPVVKDVVEGSTSGVDIVAGDREGKKYDNAYATTASFQNAGSITGAGVLFIPEIVLGSDELTATTPTVANAYKAGAYIGEGDYTIKAAIRSIPRTLAGRDIKLVVRPYVLSGETYTYGTAATTTINFTNTAE